MSDDLRDQMRRATAELVGIVLFAVIVIGGGFAVFVHADRQAHQALGTYIVFPEGWRPVASYSNWGWVCVNDEGVYRECEPHAVDAP